ncbi:sulfatase-like hydrolase/transferase [Streptomyces sp. MZ04]|uniref:sulfatase-like hydrolase/transferase n=1 Tax=Streptomyces sp. MZ04 TaxID=2559236 RepID=UPI00107E9C7D|nr:sulfatase-like hydrolase/transferase [Streptomyces sp. MZ04]TGB08977.1 LPXTG cell wall anchor domain-containing protein [Streptomyces sp. MZ04]
MRGLSSGAQPCLRTTSPLCPDAPSGARWESRCRRRGGAAAAEARERPFRAARRPGGKRPNILFVLGDDLGWADLSSYGSPHISTPNLDRLARQGVRFTDAYSGSATCSPTRFSLYTGRFPGRTKGGLAEPIADRSVGLEPTHPTLAWLLRDAGYATALIGKWHCGYLPDYSPTRSGWARPWMRLRCSEGDLGADCKEDGTSHKTPMGGGGWEAGLNSPELLHNKWLTGGEVAKVGKSGTYTLRPLYGSGGGVRALDIPLGDDRLVVELRHESGTVDGEIQGVHAYRVPGGDYAKSALLDPTSDADADALKAGTALTDEARKVKVEVVKAGAESATVKVSLNGVAAPAKPEQAAEKPNDARPEGDPTELAETGGNSDTTLAYSIGGALLLASGGAFLLKSRRRS